MTLAFLEAPRVTANTSARAIDALRRLVRALHVSTHALERELGVSGAQLFVLRQLGVTPRASLTEVAARARTARSSASEVVTTLVRRGLVARERGRGDRRRVELTLTTGGRALLARAPVTVEEQLIDGFERLDPWEKRALISALEGWLASSGLEDVPSSLFLE